MSNALPAPDPYDPAAVAFAAELAARGEAMRVNTGTVISIRPDRVAPRGYPRRPLRTAVMITKLTEAEREWLATYKREATRKRRADRELERLRRRGEV